MGGTRLEGQVAIVSGSTRGIGKATAELFAQEGSQVVVTGRDEASGQAVVEEINGQKGAGAAFFCPVDVTEERSWERLFQATREQFGRPRILVNNAGVFQSEPIESMSLEQFRFVMRTNLEGTFLGTKHAIAAMKRSEGPCSIVNVSSIAGLIGMAFSTAYSASKGAVRLFTKAAALECAQLGYPIRINSVHPTFVETDMVTDAMAGYASLSSSKDPGKVRRALERLHPLGRFAEADEVARAVLYLASDDAAYVTGTELVIDGGFTAR